MRRCLSILAVACALAACSISQAKEPPTSADGWVDLVGSDLEKNWTTKGNWSLKDGVFTITPRPGEKGRDRFDAYLWSKKTYEDFEVEFEYKVEKGGNSGFYFRVGDMKSPVAKGIEVQIYDAPAKKGAKLSDHDSGGIIPGVPPTKSSAKPAGEWNKFHIINKGDKLTVKLNGEAVNEVDLTKAPLKDRPKIGSIGFQDHALPLALRNIKIKELK